MAPRLAPPVLVCLRLDVGLPARERFRSSAVCSREPLESIARPARTFLLSQRFVQPFDQNSPPSALTSVLCPLTSDLLSPRVAPALVLVARLLSLDVELPVRERFRSWCALHCHLLDVRLFLRRAPGHLLSTAPDRPPNASFERRRRK